MNFKALTKIIQKYDHVNPRRRMCRFQYCCVPPCNQRVRVSVYFQILSNRNNITNITISPLYTELSVKCLMPLAFQRTPYRLYTIAFYLWHSPNFQDYKNNLGICVCVWLLWCSWIQLLCICVTLLEQYPNSSMLQKSLAWKEILSNKKCFSALCCASVTRGFCCVWTERLDAGVTLQFALIKFFTGGGGLFGQVKFVIKKKNF